MNYIVRKSDKIARHTKNSVTRILRTPLTKTFTAVERAVYQVGGHYNSNNVPDRGFIDSNTERHVLDVADNCMKALHNIDGKRPALQIWRAVNTDTQPMTVWYNGQYATSATSLDAAIASCEAYYQMGAYKFKIPSVPSNLGLTVSIIYETGGALVGQGPAASKLATQYPLREAHYSGFDKNWDDGYPYPVNFALYFGDLPSRFSTFHYQNVEACDYVEGFDMLADGKTGEYRGARDLWGFSGTKQDGGIPTLTTTKTKTKNLTPAEASLFLGHTTVWVIPYFRDIYDSKGQTLIFNSKENKGWWACMSVWRPRLKITLGD